MLARDKHGATVLPRVTLPHMSKSRIPSSPHYMNIGRIIAWITPRIVIILVTVTYHRIAMILPRMALAAWS